MREALRYRSSPGHWTDCQSVVVGLPGLIAGRMAWLPRGGRALGAGARRGRVRFWTDFPAGGCREWVRGLPVDMVWPLCLFVCSVSQRTKVFIKYRNCKRWLIYMIFQERGNHYFAYIFPFTHKSSRVFFFPSFGSQF